MVFQLFIEKRFANTPLILKNSPLTCSNDHNDHQSKEWVVEQNYRKPIKKIFF
jgi:hypothetical protein